MWENSVHLDTWQLVLTLLYFEVRASFSVATNGSTISRWVCSMADKRPAFNSCCNTCQNNRYDCCSSHLANNCSLRNLYKISKPNYNKCGQRKLRPLYMYFNLVVCRSVINSFQNRKYWNSRAHVNLIASCMLKTQSSPTWSPKSAIMCMLVLACVFVLAPPLGGADFSR